MTCLNIVPAANPDIAVLFTSAAAGDTDFTGLEPSHSYYPYDIPIGGDIHFDDSQTWSTNCTGKTVTHSSHFDLPSLGLWGSHCCLLACLGDLVVTW